MACFMYVHACPFESMYMQPAGTRKEENTTRRRRMKTHARNKTHSTQRLVTPSSHVRARHAAEGRTYVEQTITTWQIRSSPKCFLLFSSSLSIQVQIIFDQSPLIEGTTTIKKKSSNPYRMNEIK